MTAEEMLWGALMAAILGGFGFISWLIRRHAEKLDAIPEKYATRQDLKDVAERIERVGDKVDSRLGDLHAGLQRHTELLAKILQEERYSNSRRPPES